MRITETCPCCGHATERFRNPLPTADVIVAIGDAVVLIRRKNPPPGWAIPGGFVDYGESVEAAVRREMKEETNLELAELEQFHVYSDPDRDPRFHTICTVFLARGVGELRAGDDAGEARVVRLDELPTPEELAFDHHHILSEYAAWRLGSGADAAELP